MDSLGRVTGQEIFKKITGIEKKEYLCGRNDRLLSVNDNGKVRQYEYDRWSTDKDCTWEYRYDDVGNLVRKKDIHGATWRYEWNDAGMLSRVKRPDSGEITFRYDALGRWIEKRFNRAITQWAQWVWDGNVPLHEWKEIHKLDNEKLKKETKKLCR